MENGVEGRLADKLSGLGINDDASSINSGDNHRDGLAQVMKAVEAAEATIMHQIEENVRLRLELHDKIQELEKYKAYGSTALKQTASAQDDHFYGAYEVHQPALSVGNPEDSAKRMGDAILRDQAGTIISHDLKPSNEGAARQGHDGIHSEIGKVNGCLEVVTGPQVSAENSGFSRITSPSTTSLSLNRYQTDRDYERQFNHHGQGLIAEVDGSVSLHSQDLVQKIQEQEQEIIRLKRHLADYSVKEARICNEKYVLDKRIAYMRLAFDQQQQDLVDAASKAISYRQDIMEENIRLSYQLQAAQQERLTFVSSLLPLLVEYSLQPRVPDAQSIVSNVKVLFKHLQEKLNVTEAKLKESHIQIGAWSSDFNPSTFAPQSPAHLNESGLELVPQQMISHGNVAASSSDDHASAGWDLLNHHQTAPSAIESKSTDHNNLGLHSPFASRTSTAVDMAVTPTQGGGPLTLHNEENGKQVTFQEPVGDSQLDYPDTKGSRGERPPPGNRASGNSSNAAAVNYPNSLQSLHLAPVMEEPYSSISDVAEDDPAIEGLQISGDAFPGSHLQACGYSINGTTSCTFEWVRHLEDGSVNYIEGAKQPNYLVTADDVDTYLAIEVQPLDDRKRKGELVKVFANEHRKITCDPEMQNCIERTLYSGHASYKISLSQLGYLHIWEPGILAIKREGYSIKCSGHSGVVVTEKFSPTMSVSVPYGDATAFLMIGSNGEEHLLRVENGSEDVSCARDTMVLILRLFIVRAGEKRKGKKRGLFLLK